MIDALIAAAVALVPGTIVLLIYTLRKRSLLLLLISIIGGGGWLIALIARLPFISLINKYCGLFPQCILLLALLAGLFEEVTRYILVRVEFIRGNEFTGAVILGLGWGLTEALLVYVVSILTTSSIMSLSLIELLPGAIERNAAIVAHVVFSLLAYYAVIIGVKWLFVLIALHTLVDFIAVEAFSYTRNVWITELVLAVLVSVLFIIVFLMTQRVKDKCSSSQK